MRDTQRKRVYDAEDAVIGKARLNSLAGKLSLAEATSVIMQLCRHPLIQARYEPMFRAPIIVEDGRKMASGGLLKIVLPRWARFDWVICHELAHLILHREQQATFGRRNVYAGHGPEFCSIYLDLVEAAIGIEARQQLIASFIKHRVQYRPTQQLHAQLAAAKPAPKKGA